MGQNDYLYNCLEEWFSLAWRFQAVEEIKVQPKGIEKCWFMEDFFVYARLRNFDIPIYTDKFFYYFNRFIAKHNKFTYGYYKDLLDYGIDEKYIGKVRKVDGIDTVCFIVPVTVNEIKQRVIDQKIVLNWIDYTKWLFSHGNIEIIEIDDADILHAKNFKDALREHLKKEKKIFYLCPVLKALLKEE